jgi:cytochrome c oxidase assembly protein subunit 20
VTGDWKADFFLLGASPKAASVSRASNWAVGAFACGSLAYHEYCQMMRQREIEGMKRAVEVLHRKRQLREQKEKQAGLLPKKPEEQKGAEEPKKDQRSWWSFWR